MRVIAGIAKGTKLIAPRGNVIRPTLDRVRTSLFDIIGHRITGQNFLDLFAGTGANGIEALSRGAKMACFVDESYKAIHCIEMNLKKTHLADKAIVIKAQLPHDIKILPNEMDIIFMDPPYDFRNWESLLHNIIRNNILRNEGILIIEHSNFNLPPDEVPPLKRYRCEKYGDTFLSFYY